jgi:hypothetical protein
MCCRCWGDAMTVSRPASGLRANSSSAADLRSSCARPCVVMFGVGGEGGLGVGFAGAARRGAGGWVGGGWGRKLGKCLGR